MTKEEAIDTLRLVKWTECIGCKLRVRNNGNYCKKICGIPDALDMAIEALEQPDAENTQT